MRDQVFISYAHQDKDWLERLLLKLKPAQRNQTIQLWTDQDIKPGQRWQPAIEQARDRTAVVVFLVSDHFLASDFIQREELGHFLAMLDEAGIALCWVRLDHCLVEDSPLPERQAVGDIKIPWIDLNPAGQDKALYELVRAIKAAYAQATLPPPATTTAKSLERVPALCDALAKQPEAGSDTTATGIAANDAGVKGATPSIHQEAVAAIKESLDLLSALRESLSHAMTGDPGATACALAERLCVPDADGFQAALGQFKDALDGVRKPARQGRIEGSWLREGATEILGWMVVTAVLDQYDEETAPAVQAWKKGAALHIPFERSHCVEVLSACWLRRKAKFGLERYSWCTGEDDLTDKPLSELGFNRPFESDSRLLIDTVWKLIHQKLWPGESVPQWVTPEMRTRIGTRMKRKRADKTDPRWFRLVVDSRDVHFSEFSTSALQSIAAEIKLLQLIVVGDTQDDHSTSGIFLFLPGELAAEIDECLEKIDSLQ